MRSSEEIIAWRASVRLGGGGAGTCYPLDAMLENRWAMLAVVFISRTAMGLMYQSLAAVGAFVVEDLGLTYFQYSLLLGLFLLPGGVMALPGGLLGQRFGSRHIASGGLALML